MLVNRVAYLVLEEERLMAIPVGGRTPYRVESALNPAELLAEFGQRINA
jgi:hypothetical protein